MPVLSVVLAVPVAKVALPWPKSAADIRPVRPVWQQWQVRQRQRRRPRAPLGIRDSHSFTETPRARRRKRRPVPGMAAQAHSGFPHLRGTAFGAPGGGRP